MKKRADYGSSKVMLTCHVPEEVVAEAARLARLHRVARSSVVREALSIGLRAIARRKVKP